MAEEVIHNLVELVCSDHESIVGLHACSAILEIMKNVNNSFELI